MSTYLNASQRERLALKLARAAHIPQAHHTAVLERVRGAAWAAHAVGRDPDADLVLRVVERAAEDHARGLLERRVGA